ncbi:MAG: hypothetical protein V1918_00095 [Planctomycetota bacterium]
MSGYTLIAGKEAPSPPPVAQDERKEGRRTKRVAYKKLAVEDGDGEAKRLAAAILEVLAGGRTPTEAATALGISPPRYYALEQRALNGLIASCRRRPRGRGKTAEREVEKLRAEIRRLERDCGRWQALLRAAQRTVGLPAPQPAKPSAGRKRGPRRSRVARALRAAGALKAEAKVKPVEEPLEKGGGIGDDAALEVK